MPSRIRIGAVGYLNSRPLVFGLQRGLGADRLELSCAMPAVLARRLSEGELDVALLPVAALTDLSDSEIVPGLGITTRGPARSVLLVSKRPPREVESLALDPESRTSNLLARVLLGTVWLRRPRVLTGAAGLEESLSEADAAVRIGDKALFERVPPGCVVHDLGTAWHGLTGLPFVFAAWVARPGIVDRELCRILHDSRRDGARNVSGIAEEFSWCGRRDPELARRYLTEHIRYRLGSAELKAMRRFFETAVRLDLLERAPRIRLALSGSTPREDTELRPSPSLPWKMAGDSIDAQ